MNSEGPQRIVCLTEEPTEILYLLGEQHRIVGISVYTVRPEEAKENHPAVSAFIDGSVKKICNLFLICHFCVILKEEVQPRIKQPSHTFQLFHCTFMSEIVE